MKNRVIAAAQFHKTDLVSYVQEHLIIVNKKNAYIHTVSIIQGVECGTRNIMIGE